MKTIEVRVYEFDELSKEVQGKIIERERAMEYNGSVHVFL